MRLIETDSLSNQNISSALSIGSYTSTAVGGVIVRVLVNQAAGGGDYIIYATLTKSAVEYRVIPITTATAAAALTSLAFISLTIPVDVSDVLQVYIDGLAGDTTTPDTRVDFYTYDYLRPTVTGRTLDVSATGEAGLDFDNVKAATAPTTLTNITVPTVTTLTNMPAAAPSAATIAAEILVTPANKLATGAAGVASANVTTLAGQTEPIDNLVLSLGNGGLVEKLNSMLEAAGADYRFTAEALAKAPTGTGTGLYTDTVTVRVSGLPVDGALVQVATDSAFANIVRSGYTNSLGQVTFQYDSVGTYYGRAELAGYNIATFTITVSA